MFRKYEKTFRISPISGKLVLTPEEVRTLFNGEVVIEEKMDGANVGIIRHKKGFHLQKRGSLVGPSEHKQFQYFHAWANYLNYDKIMNIPMNYILYCELLYVVHTIYYDRLPDYVLCFDIWNGKRYLNRDERSDLCYKLGFHQVPIINRGNYYMDQLISLIPKESVFGKMSEGIVVKRYKKSGEYYKGKIVKPQFIKEMEESDHWMHKEIKINKLYLDNRS